MASKRSRKTSWLHHHSLSIVSVLLLVSWIVAYHWSDPTSHLGAFFGNAIADWSGSVVIILGTKFLYEVGSAESRPVKNRKGNRWLELFYEHSLLIFLAVTGIGWLVLYLHMNPQDKWGQVVGNIVSEWLQMAGLVFLTKSLLERGSKESR
jgi:hypothetical protein